MFLFYDMISLSISVGQGPYSWITREMGGWSIVGQSFANSFWGIVATFYDHQWYFLIKRIRYYDNSKCTICTHALRRGIADFNYIMISEVSRWLPDLWQLFFFFSPWMHPRYLCQELWDFMLRAPVASVGGTGQTYCLKTRVKTNQLELWIGILYLSTL